MADVAPLHPGFGLYKRKASTFATHREFIEHYARRYWNRSRSFFDDRVQRTVDQWIDDGLAAAAVEGCGSGGGGTPQLRLLPGVAGGRVCLGTARLDTLGCSELREHPSAVRICP